MGESGQLWNQFFCEGGVCMCETEGVKGSQRTTFVPLPGIGGL